MNPQELARKLKTLIQSERQTTKEILHLLNYALEKKSYLELGYPSLFAWLVEGFGYSNAAAYRRIEAARLLKQVPQIEEKLQAGSLNLSTLSRAQTYLKA